MLALPPPPKMGKKDAVRGNFNLFHLCFTNEIRGGGINIHCLHAKWKGVGGQALVHGGRGCGSRGLAPLENKKNEAVKRNFHLFHLYFTNDIRGRGIGIHVKWKGVGRTGVCPW